MSLQLLVAGGGIGGLAAALAASRQGAGVKLIEKAEAFNEVGAGVQLGPNVVRVLQGWGLDHALQEVAAFPERLTVRDARTGRSLGQLQLGSTMTARYGAPYAAIHRADLHRLLLQAVQHTGTSLQVGVQMQAFEETADAVHAQASDGQTFEAHALVGADGLWSTVRQQLLGDGLPHGTGHLAYRALALQSDLPQRLRTRDITVWMGPRMHVVHYPVRRGELLNVVAFVHGELGAGVTAGWDHSAHAADLAAALADTHAGLQDLMKAVSRWRLWPMLDRPPMQGPHQHAQGRIALLGDAAHPMRPYLAQGAGMAIEDAGTLGEVLALTQGQSAAVPAALQRYAATRWQRNARVQARALRNGRIFHATGPVRWGRDAAMKLFGERLLDVPWLYGLRPTRA
ncbi:MAG: FAD-dependent oxidoreductase [Polaromonas sp.]|nr:FAD-dependent oxidoreductase [Polaromonas sp.]